MNRRRAALQPSFQQQDKSEDVSAIPLAFGAMWGVFVGLGVRFSNENYELIKATLDGAQTGQPNGPLVLLFTVVSVAIFLLVLLVGLVAFRKSQKFWHFVGAVVAGFIGANVLQSLMPLLNS